MEFAGFMILAGASILGAFSVVLQRNALYGALSLVGVFAVTAVLYLMLSAPFLAVIQVIVYAGAIMVLFIFVIMLLSVRYQESGEAEGVPAGMKRMVALGLGGLFTALIALMSVGMVVSGRSGGMEDQMGTVEAVGLTLYKKFIFPFELASILLLVAIIGAVAITRRHGRGLEGHVGTEEEA